MVRTRSTSRSRLATSEDPNLQNVGSKSPETSPARTTRTSRSTRKSTSRSLAPSVIAASEICPSPSGKTIKVDSFAFGDRVTVPNAKRDMEQAGSMISTSDVVSSSGRSSESNGLLNEMREIAQQLTSEPAPLNPSEPEIETVAEEPAQAIPVPARPPFKQRLGSYLRNRLNFSRKNTEIIASEDAGVNSKTSKPLGLKFNFTNQVFINIPIKSRLAVIASYLGFNHIPSLIFYSIIYLLSFWSIKCWFTYKFPSDEESKVRYFYEMLTREKAVNFVKHLEAYETWFVVPNFSPELLAVVFTILVASVVSKMFKKTNATAGIKVPMKNMY